MGAWRNIQRKARGEHYPSNSTRPVGRGYAADGACRALIEAPVGSTTVEKVCSIMNQNPPWAEGLPLSSAGYKGEKFYFKD